MRGKIYFCWNYKSSTSLTQNCNLFWYIYSIVLIVKCHNTWKYIDFCLRCCGHHWKQIPICSALSSIKMDLLKTKRNSIENLYSLLSCVDIGALQSSCLKMIWVSNFRHMCNTLTEWFCIAGIYGFA